TTRQTVSSDSRHFACGEHNFADQSCICDIQHGSIAPKTGRADELCVRSNAVLGQELFAGARDESFSGKDRHFSRRDSNFVDLLVATDIKIAAITPHRAVIEDGSWAEARQACNGPDGARIDLECLDKACARIDCINVAVIRPYGLAELRRY